MNPKLIYIDAGHGGTDPGAVGAQAREKVLLDSQWQRKAAAAIADGVAEYFSL